MSAAALKMFRGLANEHGKFAIELGAHLKPDEQAELERMQLAGEIRLIDVSGISVEPGVFRIFQFTPWPPKEDA